MFKKMLIIFAVLVFVSLNAYAAPINSANGELDFSAAVTSGDPALVVGLSPSVVAYYLSNGTDEVASQWYAISTLHPGGNLVYGTAQDVNNVYSQDYKSGDTTSNYLTLIPTDPQSASVWSDEGWKL